MTYESNKSEKSTKSEKPGAFVRVSHPQASIPNPQTQIAIAIDTAYISSTGGTSINEGVYMMDNMLALDSTGEGGLELTTVCNVGSLIGFSVYPIDTNSGDSVAITGMNVSQGNVFGGTGYPIQQTPSYWIGQATQQGYQTYQIQVKVTTGGLRPVSYYINWDPHITAK